MRDRFGIFGTVTRFREFNLLLVMMLRIPNNYEGEVVRSEDIQFKQNYPEETVASSQV